MKKYLLFFLTTVIFFFIYQYYVFKKVNVVKSQYIEDVVNVPFEFIDGKIIIDCTYKNKGYRFLVDTGASNSVIYNSNRKSFLYLIGVDINNYPFFTQVINMENLSIGGRKIYSSYFRNMKNTPILYDGIIGNNILQKYNVLIDFNKKILSLSSKKKFILENNIFTNVHFRGNKIYVKINTNNFLLDTGANNVLSIITDSLKQKAKYQIIYGNMLKGITKKNIYEKEFIAEITNFKISNKYIVDTLQLYTSKQAKSIMGTGFLKNFKIAINYKDRTVYIQKDKKNGFIHNELGFRIGENNIVDYVISNSIADKRGIKVGAIVKKINKKILNSRDKFKIQEMKTFELTILQDGKMLNFYFPTK